MAQLSRTFVHVVSILHVCVLINLTSIMCISQMQLTELEGVINNVLKCRNVPAASVMLFKDGKVLMEKGFGKADPENNISARDDTKFGIGSLTKAFTAIILSKLVNERKNITFDTPIRDIIGNSFRLSDDVRTNLVSLRDLLSHRVGVPAYFKALLVGIPSTVDRAELIRRLQYMPAAEPIRTKFLYSNYMYTLAGYVAERMSGKSWENLVQKYILDPLGMTNSGFIDRLFNFTNFALPTAIKNGEFKNLEPTLLHSVSPCGPAGSLYSTAEDMGKWTQMLLNEGKTASGTRVFAPDLITDMYEPGMAAPLLQRNLKRPIYPIGDVQMTYDLAWVTSIYRGFKMVWHSGGIITHSSRLWLFPDMNIGIFSVVNGPQTHEKSLALRAIMSYSADLLLGENQWLNSSTICTYPAPWEEEYTSHYPPRVSEAARVTKRPVQDYVGSYFHKGFGEIKVELKEGTSDSLIMKYGRFGSLYLYPQTETIFNGRFYGPLWFMTDSDDQYQPEVVEFVKHKDNRISGLVYAIDSVYNSTMFNKGSYYPTETVSKWTFPCPMASSCSSCFSNIFLIVCIFLAIS